MSTKKKLGLPHSTAEEYIEEEVIGNEISVIEEPFDPKKIKVNTYPQTLGQIIDRLEYNEVKLDPEFQRDFEWDEIRQSQFIESILLRIPLPTFYFDGADENKWQVIDGVQRITTLKKFVLDKSLQLQGLEFLQGFNGFYYDDLTRDLQRRISTFPITVYVVEQDTPDQVKYIIFSRINRGGMILKPQQIRHALYQGTAANLVKELAESDDFIEATEGKIPTAKMQDRDFVTRFVSFYLIDYKNYEPGLDDFMNKGMAAIEEQSDIIDSLKRDFRRAMRLAIDVFGNDAFRKRFSSEEYRKPINKALFEVISVSFAKLSSLQRKTLRTKKALFRQKFIHLMNKNDKFILAITRSTASKSAVEQRFKDIERIIEETLDD